MNNSDDFDLDVQEYILQTILGNNNYERQLMEIDDFFNNDEWIQQKEQKSVNEEQKKQIENNKRQSQQQIQQEIVDELRQFSCLEKHKKFSSNHNKLSQSLKQKRSGNRQAKNNNNKDNLIKEVSSNNNLNKKGKKKKLYYKNRISSLMNNEQGQKNENFNHKEFRMNSFINYGQDLEAQINQQQVRKQSLTSQIKDKKAEQLKKNRQSAKRSRQMRNQYVQRLEMKNKQYQKKITQLQMQLRETQLQRDRLKQCKNSNIQSFYQVENLCFQKLAEMLQKINLNEQVSDELDACINSMQQTYGSAGKQRINLLNYHMSQIIEKLFLDFQKYMINCAINKNGLFALLDQNFSQSDITLIDYELNNLIGCASQQKFAILARIYQKSFHRQVIKLSKICQDFYKNFTLLVNQVNIMETVFNQVKKDYQPQQIASLVLYFQNNKHREDIRQVKKQWIQLFKGSQDDMMKHMTVLKKKNKVQ